MGIQDAKLMVDFETLGVSRDSVILSCGLVVFDRNEILREDYEIFDVCEQIADGHTVEKATVDWWRATDPKAFKDLMYTEDIYFSSTAYIQDIVKGILGEYRIKEVWSRGYMDFDMLNSRLTKEFPYYTHRDVRTLDTFGKKMPTNSHNALEDCRNQVKYVQEVLKGWTGEVIQEKL